MNNEDLIEDAINSFALAYKMSHPNLDGSANMIYNIHKDLVDNSTGEKFNIIHLLYIGPIRSIDINYCKNLEDIIVYIDFKSQDNEMAEFVANQYGFLKKYGSYFFKFDHAGDFIRFFCRLMQKSMKTGSIYQEWMDPDEGYIESVI